MATRTVTVTIDDRELDRLLGVLRDGEFLTLNTQVKPIIPDPRGMRFGHLVDILQTKGRYHKTYNAHMKCEIACVRQDTVVYLAFRKKDAKWLIATASMWSLCNVQKGASIRRVFDISFSDPNEKLWWRQRHAPFKIIGKREASFEEVVKFLKWDFSQEE